MTKTERVNSLDSSKSALETQQSLIELQRLLTEFNPADLVKQAIAELQETPKIYGELIAEQIVPVTEPLVQILNQVQDVSSQLEATLSALNTRLAPPKKAAPKQAPKPTLKDQVRSAMPWLLVGVVVLQLVTLGLGLLQA
ncbi:hypothetical protein D3C84_635640 [compost metagenome]